MGVLPQEIPVCRHACQRAAGLCAVHGLRAYDAVPLGCALAARAADPQVEAFVGFDRRLQQAAAREGMRALP